MVERNLAKVEVESSRLFSRSRFQKGKRRLPFLSRTSRFSGAVAKRLCPGLQIRLDQFDSGPRLQTTGGFQGFKKIARAMKIQKNCLIICGLPASVDEKFQQRTQANAGIAQLVERNLAKVEVESSRLFSRSSSQREASASLFLWVNAIAMAAPDSFLGLHHRAAPVTLQVRLG